MDLFEDLPAPADSSMSTPDENNGEEKTDPIIQSSGPGLFDDLPEETKPVSDVQTSSAHCASLFDDLPGTTGGGRATSPKEPDRIQGQKRKCGDDIGSVKKPASSKVTCRLRSYVCSLRGERQEMQDKHVVIDDFTDQVKQRNQLAILRLAYHAVFDGHAGKRASTFAAENLHRNISDKFPTAGDMKQLEKDIKKCLTAAYKKTDDDFLKEAGRQKPTWKDGSTATTILTINDTLYIANLGDSRAVLCRENDQGEDVPIILTVDHEATVYEERMRIQKAGGYVKDGRVNGIIEVSRSFGDGPLKSKGVSCIPSLKRCPLTDRDKYILLACDGLWKSFTPKECFQKIAEILKGEESRGNKSSLYEKACSHLATRAVRNLSGDNVTVILIVISKI